MLLRFPAMTGFQGSSCLGKFALDNIVCLDFEASALGRGSYPIEAGIAVCRTGETQSWLIRPARRWITEGIWTSESGAVHGIDPKTLAAEGIPVALVAEQLEKACRGMRVLCDGGEHDRHWLHVLFAETGGDPPFLIEDYHAFAFALATSAGRRPDIAIGKAELEAQLRFPVTHRAGDDARSLAETLRLIAGWP